MLHSSNVELVTFVQTVLLDGKTDEDVCWTEFRVRGRTVNPFCVLGDALTLHSTNQTVYVFGRYRYIPGVEMHVRSTDSNPRKIAKVKYIGIHTSRLQEI